MGILDSILGIFKGGSAPQYKRLEKLIKTRTSIQVGSLTESELEAELKALVRDIEREDKKAAKGLKKYIQSGNWKKLL